MLHWVILLLSCYSLSINTTSLGHPLSTLFWPILQTLPHWVILLLSCYSLSINTTSLGHPLSTLFWPILQTLPHWVILLSSYCSLSTVTDSLVIFLSPYYGLFYKQCLTGSSSSYPIIACLQTLPHWVILSRPYFGLF